MSKPPLPLEARIAAALNDAVKAVAVTALIAEVEAAAGAAEETATQAREQALDPTVEVDTVKVAAAIVAAELTRDRLRAALPRLRQRFTEVRLQEDVLAWNVTAEELKRGRDELVAEFAQMLPVELIKRIVAQLYAMREFDGKINGHNHFKPDDRGARLLPCALPAFAQELKIPDMDRPPGNFLWPPPPPNLSYAIRPDPFVGAFAADGTYARLDDKRRREADERQREEERRREREFEARQGGR